MENLAFCISGGASTACAIIDSCFEGDLVDLVRPALVIASHHRVTGIERVVERLAFHTFDRLHYGSTDKFGGQGVHGIRAHFMRVK